MAQRRQGATPVLNSTWDSSANPSGPGFSGSPAFNGGDGLSDRSRMLAGKALNLVDARNESVEVVLGSAQLGNSFSISTWQYLSPGATNASNRYFVFEASDNFDVSWGSTTLTGTLPTTNPIGFAAYIGETGPVGTPSTLALSQGEWHQVVHTFSSDGTTTTLQVYVDGVVTGLTGTKATVDINFASLYFGRQRGTNTTDRDWDGMLDEIGIWDRALTASEVSDLRALGLAGLSVVPEPGTAALAGMLGLVLALRRRR